MKKKPLCDRKKMNALLRVLLFNFFLLYTPFLGAQNDAPDSNYFDTFGGIEISMAASDFSHDVLDIKGLNLDHGTNQHTIHLFMNQQAYNQFVMLNLPHRVHKREKASFAMKAYDQIAALKSGDNCLPVFDFYPTYEAYENIMYDFEKNYPDICRIINLGTLASGRKILVAHIGDNLSAVEDEPNFLYTSTMHGDETGGYPTMIKLIDELLCNYGDDDRITHLVNNINIYINPLANPNGTYRGGNDSVDGAIRYNNTFADLNRNFPDPEDGDHPDGRSYQEETEIFMSFAQDYNISLSCNIHGGAEVANYPWDTYQKLPADVNWWVEQCRTYVDTVYSYSDDNYFRGFDNGISNGYAWYEVQGGRQDHMIYFHRGREFTLEISNRKLVRSEDLPEVWSSNRSALINYMAASLHGLRGLVTDCLTGLPVEAEIIIPGHDIDNSSVFSEPHLGKYFRYLDNGQYDLMAIAEGYDTLYFSAEIADNQSTRYDVQLCPAGMTSVANATLDKIHVNNLDGTIHFIGLPQGQKFDMAIYDAEGRLLSNESKFAESSLDFNPQMAGIYLLRLSNRNVQRTFSLYFD